MISAKTIAPSPAMTAMAHTYKAYKGKEVQMPFWQLQLGTEVVTHCELSTALAAFTHLPLVAKPVEHLEAEEVVFVAVEE